MTGVISSASELVSLADAQRAQIPATYAYHFAWQAFHPNAAVFEE